LENQKYSVTPFSVAVSVQGRELPVSTLQAKLQMQVTADLRSGLLNLTGMDIQLADLRLAGDMQAQQIITAPRFAGTLKLEQFSPRQLAQQLKIVLPETADSAVLGSAAVDISYAGDTNSITLKTVQVNVDDTLLKGDVSVKQFNKPVITFNIDLNSIDLDRYLPPAVQQTPAAAPVTPASTAAAAVQLPLDTLRTLNVQGNVKVGSLTASKIATKNIIAKISAKNGKINIAPLQAEISEGKFNSDIHLDVTENTPKFALTESVTAVKVGPILQAVLENDMLSGTLNLTTELSAHGVQIDDLKRSLKGKSQFSLTSVAIKGINIAEILRETKAKLKGEDYKPSGQAQQTDFTELTGTALITNGVVTNNDLSAKSPLLRVVGEGKVDLPNDKVNYLVTTYIVGTAQGQEGKDLDELKGIPIPIHFRGPLAAPDYEVDYDSILKEYKNKYKKEVKKELKQEKRQLEDKAKEKLQNQLKKLF
jgi:AsmA protein